MRILPLFLLLAACGPNVSPLAGQDTDSGNPTTQNGGSGTTGSSTGSSTGSATGQGTATSLGTDGAIRVVNLTDDTLGLTLGTDGPHTVPFAEATDGNGDYTVLAAGAADVSIEAGGAAVGAMGVTITSGEYQTLILTGQATAPAGVTLVDLVAPAPAGTHNMTIWHVSPTAGSASIIVPGFSPATVDPNGGANFPAVSGLNTIGIDVNQDGTSDLDYDFDLPDGDWSYLYLWHGNDTSRIDKAFLHVRGMPIDSPAPN